MCSIQRGNQIFVLVVIRATESFWLEMMLMAKTESFNIPLSKALVVPLRTSSVIAATTSACRAMASALSTPSTQMT